MKVSLNFEFNSNEEAEAFLRRVRERAAQVHQDAVPADTSVADKGLLPEKPKRQRKKKPEPTPEQQAAVEELTATAQANGEYGTPKLVNHEHTPATQADAQAALEQVFAAKGMTAARELLQRHGVERLKDLKPEQYPAFVGAAQEALK